MAERPIIFSGEMVRAIIAGRKTQTRRVIKPQPDRVRWSPVVVNGHGGWIDKHGHPMKCPYGQPGDLLWVRETWSRDAVDVYPCPTTWYRADFFGHDDPVVVDHIPGCDGNRADCFACARESRGGFKWRPSIHMPRWASRLTLRVADVQVEPLQDISIGDVIAEGFSSGMREYDACVDLLEQFSTKWDAINAKRGYPWESNPSVWVVEFEVMP
jgi:hypothetical protein